MQKDKIEALVGFAVKSANIIYGLDNIQRTKHKIQIIFVCRSAAENMLKKITAYAQKNNILLIRPKKLVEDFVHKTNCKAAAITDKMMACGISENLSDDYEVLNGGIAN